MSIVVSLTPDTERRLRERAARSGRDAESLASELIERTMRAEPALAELLAPFRNQVAQSGLSDEELRALFEEARNEIQTTGKSR